MKRVNHATRIDRDETTDRHRPISVYYRYQYKSKINDETGKLIVRGWGAIVLSARNALGC